MREVMSMRITLVTGLICVIFGMNARPVQVSSIVTIRQNKVTRGFSDSLPDHYRQLAERPFQNPGKWLTKPGQPDLIHQHDLHGIEVFSDPNVREELIVKDYDRGVNAITLVQSRFPWLTGRGLQISIKENLFDTADIDLKGRILPISPAGLTVTTHATTMATIIAGSGNTSKDSKGLAPEVRLSASSFLNLFPDDDRYFVIDQITVQNHSYGLEIENFYGAEAQAYDQFAGRNPKVLHVFSAGNQGNQPALTGIYAGLENWANLTGNFKMAKNILTVGAIDSSGLVPELSSRGPAYDGRIKPELVAMGQRGSSESAATVSGATLLLQQAYREIHDSLPDAGLVKNILINSADDIGNRGPDFATGFGSLNLFQAIRTLTEGRYFTGTVTADDPVSFRIDVPDNIRLLKLTLTWIDPAAPLNANKALINDLDMVLNAGDGNQWLPWVPNAFPHPDSLIQLPVRKRDELNNVEQITLENPLSRQYTVKVSAHLLATDRQFFHLSYQMDTADSFLWLSPVSGETLEAGRETVIRWNQYFDAENGLLEYSTDDGQQWHPVPGPVKLSQHHHRWRIPNVFSEARLRMTIGDRVFYSDVFTISARTRLTVGFDCDDRLMLQWNAVSGATGYRLYHLLDGKMAPLVVTADSSIVLQKSGQISRYFAAEPVNADGLAGFRSDAIDYTNQGSFCYITGFFTSLREDAAVLDLSLSSIEGVSHVRIEKEDIGQFITIVHLDKPDQLRMQWTDNQLTQGLNTYRAVVVLDNGTELISEPNGVYFRGTNEVLVFPNPATADADLTVLTKGVEQGRFRLFESLGRLINSYEILAGQGQILLGHLPSGLYHYTLEMPGRELSGNFVIH
jgi:hypothetical protein